MLNIKAYILSLIFLFSGNGIHIDIAQCCNKISGISFSLKNQQHTQKDDCCACVVNTKKDNCCQTIVIQTVVNQSLFQSVKVKNEINKFFVSFPKFNFFKSAPIEFNHWANIETNEKFQIPILLKKRVLQI